MLKYWPVLHCKRVVVVVVVVVVVIVVIDVVVDVTVAVVVVVVVTVVVVDVAVIVVLVPWFKMAFAASICSLVALGTLIPHRLPSIDQIPFNVSSSTLTSKAKTSQISPSC